jgi:hypothetical protein
LLAVIEETSFDSLFQLQPMLIIGPALGVEAAEVTGCMAGVLERQSDSTSANKRGGSGGHSTALVDELDRRPLFILLHQFQSCSAQGLNRSTCESFAEQGVKSTQCATILSILASTPKMNLLGPNKWEL